MASQPFVVDLGYLWGQLGVSENGQGIVLDDRARWADIREDHLRRCKKEKVRTMTEMKIEPRQVSLSTSEASLSAQVLIDRPQEKGGADRGPMGGELFLASIGGCFMSNLLAATSARESRGSRSPSGGNRHHSRINRSLFSRGTVRGSQGSKRPVRTARGSSRSRLYRDERSPRQAGRSHSTGVAI